MQMLLEQMGAGPNGNTSVIISDVREELVLYVNGTPYLRRELEMPAAALHHAGIHATQVSERAADSYFCRGQIRTDVGRLTGRILQVVSSPELSGCLCDTHSRIKVNGRSDWY